MRRVTYETIVTLDCSLVSWTGIVAPSHAQPHYTTTGEVLYVIRLLNGVMMIRVLLVDDQPATRTGLHMLLAAQPDLLVIGEATNGQDALDRATALGPDVVLMDIEMPYMDGLTATCRLRRICPRTRVILLSIHDDADIRAQALDAGVAAFVSKFAPVFELLTAIRQVAGSGGPSGSAPGTNMMYRR